MFFSNFFSRFFFFLPFCGRPPVYVYEYVCVCVCAYFYFLSSFWFIAFFIKWEFFSFPKIVVGYRRANSAHIKTYHTVVHIVKMDYSVYKICIWVKINEKASLFSMFILSMPCVQRTASTMTLPFSTILFHHAALAHNVIPTNLIFYFQTSSKYKLLIEYCYQSNVMSKILQRRKKNHSNKNKMKTEWCPNKNWAHHKCRYDINFVHRALSNFWHGGHSHWSQDKLFVYPSQFPLLIDTDKIMIQSIK